MSTIIHDIGLLAGQNPLLAYFIIYVSIIFLGNISAFVSFWIVFQGYLGAWGVPFLIVTIFLADFTGDLLWYALGRATHNTRLGAWIRRRHPAWHEKVETALQHNGGRWIVFSKFIYAAAFPVIFSAGWSRMGLKRFVRTSLLSIALWLPILIGLAYAVTAGLSPLGAIAIFKNLQLTLVIGLALFLVLDYLIAKIIERWLK